MVKAAEPTECRERALNGGHGIPACRAKEGWTRCPLALAWSANMPTNSATESPVQVREGAIAADLRRVGDDFDAARIDRPHREPRRRRCPTPRRPRPCARSPAIEGWGELSGDPLGDRGDLDGLGASRGIVALACASAPRRRWPGRARRERESMPNRANALRIQVFNNEGPLRIISARNVLRWSCQRGQAPGPLHARIFGRPGAGCLSPFSGPSRACRKGTVVCPSQSPFPHVLLVS